MPTRNGKDCDLYVIHLYTRAKIYSGELPLGPSSPTRHKLPEWMLNEVGTDSPSVQFLTCITDLEYFTKMLTVFLKAMLARR